MEYVSAEPAKEKMMVCCDCGAFVSPNPTNLCVGCLRKEVDISEGISKREDIHFCRKCERYLNPPKSWVYADHGSKQLLELCLRKIKGLEKLRYKDADFIWTEPHSKRIKVKIDVQKEVQTGVVVQQTLVVEFTVHNQMCDDCHRVEAKDYWKARVQVRQRATHKKTLFYLEQTILKHRAHIETRTTNIKQVHEGLDFYYQCKRDAQKMVDFLKAVVPCSWGHAEELISTDIHSNTANFRDSYCVEIVPLCKDDVVCLPQKLAKQLGNISQICIVNRVAQVVQILDPSTKKISELRSEVFEKSPFKSLCQPNQLVEYTVMDTEIVGAADALRMKAVAKKEASAARHQGVESNKHALADAWVIKSSELGDDNQMLHCRTHLGHLLKPGDSVLGFDLKNSNANDPNLDLMNPDYVPDVVLVKKVYGDRNKRIRKRKWKLQHLDKEGEAETESIDRDYNDFLEDIEEDEDYRRNVNIYKTGAVDLDESCDDDSPFVKLSEMLDEICISRDATGEAGDAMIE